MASLLSSMVAESSSNLASLARSKLHSPVSGKGSLHRFVLLKNSMLSTLPLITPSRLTQSEPSLSKLSSVEDAEVEEVITEDADSFLFPDAEDLVEAGDASEAQWLDSLLETLGDDEDSDFGGASQTDDEDDPLLSPLLSPMSSSDDLTTSAYDESPISTSYSYPYPVPYPPFHPPLVYPYDDDSCDVELFPSAFDHPFPYYDEDDVLDMPVPDSIEDTSDDESDTPLTPSLGRSDASLEFIGSNRISYSPPDDRIPGSPGRGVYINTPASCFYHNPDDFHLRFIHQDC